MSKKTRNIIIALSLLLVLVLAAFWAYKANAPEAEPGEKTISVTVIHGDESRKEYSISTDAENLRQALEEEKLIEGEESEFGLFIKTADGETADDSLQQWWCLSKDGEMLQTGADSTIIADGESYELSLKTGW